MKLNWNSQRGGEVLENIPSVGEVWIFSGTAQRRKLNHWMSPIFKIFSSNKT